MTPGWGFDAQRQVAAGADGGSAPNGEPWRALQGRCDRGRSDVMRRVGAGNACGKGRE